MSKARVFGIIARSCLRFIEEHGTAALPVFTAALSAFAEIVELRAAQELQDDVTMGLLEERIHKLEQAAAKAARS